MGIVALLFSILIFVQLLMVMVNQFNGGTWDDSKIFFLSSVLKAAQEAIGVPLISTLLFAIFSLYITFCFVKGVTKFGFRFIMFISIHPMKIGRTELNSFVFNVIIMLLGIMPLLQFLTFIFKEYSYGSAVDLLFGVSVSNIQYLKEWFNWYIVIMNVLFIISLIGLCLCPGEDVYDSLDNILKADTNKGESISRVKHSRALKKEIRMAKVDTFA